MELFLMILPIVVMIGVLLLAMRWAGNNEARHLKVLVIMVVIYTLLMALKIRSDGIDSLGFFDWGGILVLLTATLSELWKRRRARKRCSRTHSRVTTARTWWRPAGRPCRVCISHHPSALYLTNTAIP